MNTTLRNIVTATIAGSAIAFGALGFSAPASAASIQQTCEQNPGAYATGAVRGVYSVQKRGFDRDQICKVYGAAGNLLGTYTKTDYGFYKVPGQVKPPPLKSSL